LLPFTKDTIIRLTAQSPTLTSQVSLLASQSNPVPMILLSKDYDFAVNPDESPTASSSASESAKQDFPEVEDPTNTNTTPQILVPKEDQSFKDQQPMFKGTTAPNEAVIITINSDQVLKATVESDENGRWEYRPTDPLDPGDHTINIETTDTDGVVQKLSQSFTVYAAGSSEFTEPSISPSMSVSPTASATPTIDQTPTPAEPTSSPSATPTFEPTPIASGSPTVGQPMAPTGSNAAVMSVIGIVSALGIGALLFFLTMV
jgi:hypothetical protein